MASVAARVIAFALAALVAGGAGGCRKKPTETFGQGGPEAWVVDGAVYRISATHFERRDGNVVVYVMKYPLPPGSATEVDNDGAGILTWPLVKYAYNNRTFHRGVSPHGPTAPAQVILAIDLFTPDGNRFLRRYETVAGK
jgi:hypothetical protein